ncbi:hypothetical protein VU02_01205, partial [Desulfobulbus sp. N2]|nr:hypothetical protein [Desulfobulbus sp. N2]
MREYLTDNRDAQILVQGLQALGSYIREEKSNAHPDAFTILHAFYDALKLLIQDTNLTAEQRKRVLMEQIGSLNSLKSIIAQSAAERAADQSAGDEKTGSEAAEPAKIAKIPAPEQESEDEAELSTVSEDDAEFGSPVADDDEDLDLFSEDFDENSDFLAGGDGVDEFFLDGDDSLSDDGLVDEESIAGDFEFDEEESGLDDDLFADETGTGGQDLSLDDDTVEEEAILPALTDADEDGGFNEELVADGIDEEKTAELDEKLDSFFDFDSPDETTEETTEPKEEVVVVEESDSPADEPSSVEVEEGDSELGGSDVELDSFFDFSDEVADDEAPKEEEKARVESWKDEILSSDLDGPDGEEEGLLEGEEDYDSFFDFDEDEDEILPDAQLAAVAEDTDDGALAASDDEIDISLDGLDDEQESEEFVVALSDADEEGGFNEDEMSSGIADEKAAELDEKLNFFFELDKEEQEESSEDQISGTVENDAVTTEAQAEPDSFDEEQDELSLELDGDNSELSFDDDEDFDGDYEGDIAGFSDIDDTEAVSVTTDQGKKSASDPEEEIEGLDAIFDLDDDAEGAPEFDKSSVGGPEEIPALDDEFVISLDDEEESTDELFDFSSDSGEEESGVSLDLGEDVDKEVVSVDVGSSAEGADDVELEDEFTLSLDDDTSDDDFADFSFDGADEGESDTSSKPAEDAEALDSFFELKEERSGDTATAAQHDEAEEEVELDEEFDSFFDLEEDLGESLESEKPKDSSSLEEPVEEIELDDEFVLSFDDEGTEEDALSDFSFASDDAEEGAALSEPASEVESEDSFFGLDEEADAKVEVAEGADRSDAEDEFALSLDDDEGV